VDVQTKFKMLNTAPDGATSVVSALGAFIACTFLLLFVLTLYMSYRVYKQNKLQVNSKASSQQDIKN
jgi:hypothetical protein